MHTKILIITLKIVIKIHDVTWAKGSYQFFSWNIWQLLSGICCVIGFGGLEVACWPLVPKFAGSNPAEAVGFLRAKKSSARLPSEGK